MTLAVTRVIQDLNKVTNNEEPKPAVLGIGFAFFQLVPTVDRRDSASSSNIRMVVIVDIVICEEFPDFDCDFDGMSISV